MFDGLESLQKLYLQKNSISNIEQSSFSNMRHLSTLFLFQNKISSISAGMFEGLPNLTVLLLVDNLLTELPAGVFRDLPSLEGLDLSGNKLVTLSLGIFSETNHLTQLIVARNQLHTLPAGLMSHVQRKPGALVILSENNLETVPDLFSAKRPSVNVKLYFGKNPLQIDSRLCLMWEGVQQDWLTLSEVPVVEGGEEADWVRQLEATCAGK